ncbi:hypothetical protein ACFW04_014674 [Cataglyphis niger]
MQAIIDQEVEDMEAAGVIEPSTSAWSSPVVLVKKKDGKYRFCIDFRKVNDATEKDAYPLPQVTATLEKLRGAKYLSTLDLKQGYWQVPLESKSRPITAFTIPGRGLYQFKVMPFGLHSAPATFQRLLDKIISPALEPNVFVYLDDIIIISKTFDDHLRLLTEVFRRLRDARLRLNPEKCKFCVDQLKYLGHVVDRKGIRTDPEKVSAIENWPEPHTVKQIRQFLGMASWYRRFIANFSTIAAPLTSLTKKNAKWKWGAEETTAFRELKKTLVSAPVLACPDFARRFVLQTDASASGLGAVLTQNFEEGERVIAYASRTLNSAEKNYSATELECLAVVWGIRRMKGYLEGYPFTVITDHQALKWLQRLEAPTGRLARWLFELQQYDLEHILHSLNFKETSADEQWKECVPKEQRAKVISQHHNEPTAGHLGIAKTIARIAEYFYWPGMFREIAAYVRTCLTCQAHKVAQEQPAGKLHATDIQKPWEQVTTDLVGPLPRSRQGHTWLFVMQDRFSKWVELAPLRQATAKATTRTITERVILRHGRPESILSDNGTQFVSKEFENRLAAFDIKHKRAPAYAPHCNPVERTNRTIKTMISEFVEKDHRDWDEHLPALQFAYNTAVHDATGYTPAYLNHGRELTPPHHVPSTTTSIPPDTTRRRLDEAYEIVRIQLARAFQRQEKYYNLRRRQWKPKIGEWVWKKDHSLSRKTDSFNAKLAPKYIGPLEVRRIISPVIVDLRSKRGKWHKHVHIQDLKENKNKAKDETPTDDRDHDTDDTEDENTVLHDERSRRDPTRNRGAARGEKPGAAHREGVGQGRRQQSKQPDGSRHEDDTTTASRHDSAKVGSRKRPQAARADAATAATTSSATATDSAGQHAPRHDQGGTNTAAADADRTTAAATNPGTGGTGHRVRSAPFFGARIPEIQDPQSPRTLGDAVFEDRPATISPPHQLREPEASNSGFHPVRG